MPHPNAITKHTVADDATFIEVECEQGLVPVAIYAAAWTPASFTLQVKLADSGLPGVTETFKATDDTAVNFTDDAWTTIPEAMGRKCAAATQIRILFNAAESGGPFTAQILWAPLGGC